MSSVTTNPESARTGFPNAAADGFANVEPASAVRMVPALVAGHRIMIECSAWCTVDHVAEAEAFLPDVSHASDRISVSAPVGIAGRTENVLEAWITQSPFTGAPEPRLAFDACGDGESAELTAAAALAQADQLVAHATALRMLARTMQGAVQ